MKVHKELVHLHILCWHYRRNEYVVKIIWKFSQNYDHIVSKWDSCLFRSVCNTHKPKTSTVNIATGDATTFISFLARKLVVLNLTAPKNPLWKSI
jgi:hypothetical protein